MRRSVMHLYARFRRWRGHHIANRLTLHALLVAAITACWASTMGFALHWMLDDGAEFVSQFGDWELILIFSIVALSSVVLLLRVNHRHMRGIFDPLNTLALAASRGHVLPAVHALPAHRRDEIGVLSRTLRRVLESEHRLRYELEGRVASRTRELAAARSRLACILESMQDMVYSVTLDLSEIIYVSPAVKSILGVSEQALYDDPRIRLQLCHPDDRRTLLEAHRHVLEEGSSEIQYRIHRPDGETRWLLDRFYVVYDETGEASHVDGMVTDITRRILAEQGRAMAQHVLALKDRALTASSNGVVIVDMLAPEQPLIYANPAFERITGYSAEEVIGRNCRFLHSQDDNQEALRELRSAIAEGRSTTVELRNYRKDGSLFWNELSVSPVRQPESNTITHYIGIQNDITLKRESEQRLFEWFVRFETIFTLSPDGLVSFGQDGRITYVNPSFERMLGLNSGDILGLSLAQLDQLLQHRADPSTPYHGLKLQQEGEHIPFGNDYIVLNSPVHRTIKWSARDCNAEAASLVMYFRDVTREAEVDRMKSDFLSTAAHELRTPMASIMGFSELLLARQFSEDRTRDMLQTINRQSVRLTNLLNELLDLARIESHAGKDFHIERQALRGLIEDTLKTIMMPNDPRSIDMALPDELPDVEVDSAKFQQALTNVISNAYKYSPAGGAITLSTASRMHGRTRQIGLAIQDHGIGMTPEQLAHVFERFYRADSSGNIPGTGLGLSLVKEIVELHRGEVEISSRFGEGTRVIIWLPIAEHSIEFF